MKIHFSGQVAFLKSKMAIGVLIGMQISAQATAQADVPKRDEATELDAVVVTYRASLNRALDLKRGEVGQVDAIVAEDIGKFPDLNLAESLQRIPGVAITRDAGEGRNI